MSADIYEEVHSGSLGNANILQLSHFWWTFRLETRWRLTSVESIGMLGLQDTWMTPHKQYGGRLCIFCCSITCEDRSLISYTVYPWNSKSVLWTQTLQITGVNYPLKGPFLASVNYFMIALLKRRSHFHPPPCRADHMDMRGGTKREEVFPLWKQEESWA